MAHTYICEFCGITIGPVELVIRAPDGQACCSEACVDLGRAWGFTNKQTDRR